MLLFFSDKNQKQLQFYWFVAEKTNKTCDKPKNKNHEILQVVCENIGFIGFSFVFTGFIVFLLFFVVLRSVFKVLAEKH